MPQKNRQELHDTLSMLDEFTQFKKFQCPPIFLLGGSGCILAKYFDRATLDFDILDIGYSADTGMYFNLLGDKDILDLYFTTIPTTSYKDRALKLEGFQNIQVFVLSREDVILSKIGRFSEVDREDIKILLADADNKLLEVLADEIMGRTDISEKVLDAFRKNYSLFCTSYLKK